MLTVGKEAIRADSVCPPRIGSNHHRFLAIMPHSMYVLNNCAQDSMHAEYLPHAHGIELDVKFDSRH